MLLRAHENDRRVVMKAFALCEGANVGQDTLRACSGLQYMVAHPLCAVLFIGLAGGLRNSVAVENQTRTFGELYPALGKFPGAEPQRHAAFALQKARALIIDQQRAQMAGTRKS